MKSFDCGSRTTIERDVLGDLIESLSQAVSHQRAVTAPGAMFQVMMVRSLVGDLIDGGDPADRSIGLSINRQLYSVLALLERLSGVSAEEVGAETYMPRNLDVGLALAARVGG